jgi:putative ABC transport system permease protein
LSAGSDVAVEYTGTLEGGEEAPFPVTSVVRVDRVSFAAGSEAELDLLLVDPDTFEEAAFWRGEFSGDPLDALMDALGRDGDRVPAIVAGSLRVPEDPILSLPGFDVPVEVVGRARTFPGIVGDRPMLVLDRHAMETATEASGLSLAQFVDGTEVWALANEQEAQTYVASRGGTVLSSTSVAWLRDTPRYLAVSSMLRFLLALGGLAAAVVLIGVALYLQSRQRRSETSYALARRMGLARASHLRSVAFEVSALLLVALAVGAGLAGFASFLVNEDVQVRSVDVDVVLFRLPIPLVAGIGAALVLFAWLAAGFAQWRADRVDVGEVMRVAE